MNYKIIKNHKKVDKIAVFMKKQEPMVHKFD